MLSKALVEQLQRSFRPAAGFPGENQNDVGFLGLIDHQKTA
jgi:hypothetical protein